jgi:hypothetical protein
VTPDDPHGWAVLADVRLDEYRWHGFGPLVRAAGGAGSGAGGGGAARRIRTSSELAALEFLKDVQAGRGS